MLIKLIKSNKLKQRFKLKGTIVRMSFIPEDLKIGSGCLLGKKTRIAGNVEIGNFSYVNSNILDTFIESNTCIGDYCSIAPGVIIGMGNHDTKLCTTHPILFDRFYVDSLGWKDIELRYRGLKDRDVYTRIGSDVWIGARANIKRGVHVGNGAVIAADAVVTKDVPDYSIVAGVPARVIGFRFDKESVDFLKAKEEYCFWNWNEKQLKTYFQTLYDVQEYKKAILEIQEITE